MIDNPTGPVNTGSGDQLNWPGTPGEPINVGTGRQFFGEDAVRAAGNHRRVRAQRRAARAERRAERAERREWRWEHDHGDVGEPTTTIIGGSGPVNTGAGAQFNRQRPDGTWETYTPGY